MEGHCEEYLANKGCVQMMFVECLENLLSTSEEDLPPVDSISTSSPPDDPQLPDSDYFLPPVANLCVTPFSTNSDMHGSIYNWHDIKFHSPLAFTSTVLHTVLLSLGGSYNAFLGLWMYPLYHLG